MCLEDIPLETKEKWKNYAIKTKETLEQKALNTGISLEQFAKKLKKQYYDKH